MVFSCHLISHYSQIKVGNVYAVFRQLRQSLKALNALTFIFSIFQTRMETTFGPAFSAVTTITKREYFMCTVSPQSTVCDPRVVVVVLQIIKLLGESLWLLTRC